MAVFTGNGSFASPSFTFSSDTDTGFYLDTVGPQPGVNTLPILTATIGGTNKVSIDSTGLYVQGGSATNAILGARALKSINYDPSTDSGGAVLTQNNGFGNFSGFYDNSAVSSASGTSAISLSAQGVGEVFKIDYSGRIILTSGAGINFGSVVGSTHTLDDYEEGTFTPGISIGGVAQTPASTTGAYRKVGELVCITGFVKLGASVTDTGAVNITGLPFIVKDATFSSIDFASSPIFTNIRPAAYDTESYYCILGGGNDFMNLYVDSISSPINTGLADETAVRSTMEFRFVVTYFAS